MTTPEVLGERYEIGGVLGRGGMAEVHRGRDLRLGREVAVKVLPASLAHDRGYVERFRAEAQRVATLQHHNIVPVYYYSERDPLLYLVMPVLKESLRDRLEREGRLDAGDAIRIAGQMADALEAAHAQGLVHRDVKPENILLDPEGTAQLTDFGIARETSLARQGGTQTLSGTGLPVGTPEYMAPEQLRNESVDGRADIYALSAVLYEMLTGHAPHEAETPYEVAALVLMTPITPPRRHNKDIWPALEDVILKGLEARPDDRFQSAEAFGAALERAGELAGTDAALDGTARLRSHATRRLTRPLELPETPEEIAEANTVPVIAVVRPTASVGILSSLRRQRVMLAATLGVLLVAALGSGTLAFFRGFTLAGAQTIFLPGDTRVITSVITATPLPSTTAAALATAIAQGSPGARATATALATQTPQTTATTVPSATASATPPQPTATPQPTVTPLPGAPLTMTGIALIKVNKSTCKGTQDIHNNSGGLTVGWHWTSVPSGFRWSLYPDTSIGHSGTPNDPGLASGASDTVYVQVPCGTYSVTVVDSLGNTYPSVTMHYP
jgi:serine/threonine protein kinase